MLCYEKTFILIIIQNTINQYIKCNIISSEYLFIMITNLLYFHQNLHPKSFNYHFTRGTFIYCS